MSNVTLYQIAGSPNNVRVRIALGFKGIEYDTWDLPMETGGFPFDRSKLVEVSGQPRTPVLKHGDTTVFDSGAIMRYLDANFRDTPPLFRPEWETHGQIEEWELWCRTALGGPIGTVFAQALAPSVDADACARARADLREATARIEKKLTEIPFLVDDHLSAADVAVAPAIGLAMIEPAPDLGPIHDVFANQLDLGEGRERTAKWARSVLAYDRLAS